jgi:type IV secretion system protein VirB9
MLRPIALLLSLLLSTQHLPAYALNVPKPSAYDTRVRYVTYNNQDVVQIETVIGIATHIVLEAGEQYLTHAFGDAQAWTFANEFNHYFIKPIAQDADTNLTIVTDRHTYYFRLRCREGQEKLAMYGVQFRYPDLKSAQKSLIERGFTKGNIKYNLAYTMSGDLDIAPVNAWDNGQFTYFKFASNTDIPGIYITDIDGNESIVNRHTIGDSNNIIVMHKVSPNWTLRLGNRALAVYNDDYQSNPVTSSTGTITPYIQRTIKGDQ